MMMMMMMMMVVVVVVMAVVVLPVSSDRPGDVRLHSPVTRLPVGAATWSTSLSPVRLQVSP